MPEHAGFFDAQPVLVGEDRCAKLGATSDLQRLHGSASGRIDREAIVGALDRWVRADALHRLASASGWPWPEGPLPATLAELARRSAGWDFRVRIAAEAAATGAERHALTSIPAEVGGKVLDEELVVAAAADLGLAGGGPPLTGPFTHVVVLGGMVSAYRRRTAEGARLAREAGIDRVAVLSAHRPLAGNEPTDAVDAGWGDMELESEAAAAAARQLLPPADGADAHATGAADVGIAVGTATGTKVATEIFWHPDDGSTPEGLDPAEHQRRRSWSAHRWTTADGVDVEVVVAPSTEPLERRTNTSDQLAFWAERAGIDETHELLLVTTDHYVPAQHFEALRTLALPRGCGISTTGVEWQPAGAGLRGAAYLQEVRSALLSAERLLNAAEALAR